MMELHVFDRLVSSIREVMPELDKHEFCFDDTFEGIGANSIDRAEIISIVLEQLSLNVPPVQFLKTSNLGELVNLLHDKTKS